MAYAALKGTPTAYEGINFRSKLEATWAAFFDLIGWSWEYEPDDFSGYIPDFVLHGTDGRRVYVEVKPYSVWAAERDGIVAKVRSSIGPEKDLLILTDDFEGSDDPDLIRIGFMPCNINDPDEGIEEAILCIGSSDFGHGVGYDFRHYWGSWEFRLSGVYEGNAHFIDVEKADFLKLWSRARNRFQWKPANG